MSDPIILLSDGEDPGTPLEIRSKKPRIIQLDLVVVEDTTPPSTSSLPIPSQTLPASLAISETNPTLHKLSGISRLICLESDSESESSSRKDSWKESTTDFSGYEDSHNLNSYSQFDSTTDNGHADVVHMFETSASPITHPQDDANQAYDDDDEKENLQTDQTNTSPKQKGKTKSSLEKRGSENNLRGNKKMTKEERARLMEEKRLKKEGEKLKNAALKAEAIELKILQKEKEKWEKGKFALKSVVAHVDARVVELGSVGGWLLSSFANKGITYRIAQNPIKRSIVWNMSVPEQILQLSPSPIEISYILFVFEAEEFCDAVNNETLLQLVWGVRNQHPSYTVCFLTNRLRAYIDKREKEHYKNPANSHHWKPPPIEEVLANLTTHYNRVHYRHCADEAELAEHVVGLTCSLASCQFRKKLTQLSVSANGSIIPKDSINKNLIKKSVWLKALLSIPKVQPRFALAIWRRYPTMKSLLQVYMDPCMTVHEKEFMLKDLMIEGLLGNDRRLGEICSKRVYRILMAQSGSIKTDDVEDGADFFRNP